MKFQFHGARIEPGGKVPPAQLRWSSTGYEWIEICLPDTILRTAAVNYNPPVPDPNITFGGDPLSEVHPADGLWLVFGGQHQVWGRRYVPSPSLELCRQFAGVADRYYARDPRYVIAVALQFGAHYGPLGHGALLENQALTKKWPTSPDFYAEPVILWLNEAIMMRAALRLRTALEEAHRKPLLASKALIGMAGDGRRVPNLRRLMDAGLGLSEYARQKGIHVSEVNLLLGRRRLSLERWLGSPAVDIDYGFLARSNEHLTHDLPGGVGGLAAEIRAELIGIIDHKLAQHTVTRCLDLANPTLACVPKNLLGHMYLSLARSFRQPRVDRCVVCGVEIAVLRRRAGGNCCGDRCAKARQRARKRMLT